MRRTALIRSIKLFLARYRTRWQRRPAAVTTILTLALGATLGASLRYYVSLWSTSYFGASFPYGTLIVNVVGSFILGSFLALSTNGVSISPTLRLLVATGFCGSLTTFSTFSYETIALLNDGSYRLAALNLVASLVLGGVGVVLGATLVHLLLTWK